jgi:hypothetical protein
VHTNFTFDPDVYTKNMLDTTDVGTAADQSSWHLICCDSHLETFDRQSKRSKYQCQSLPAGRIGSLWVAVVEGQHDSNDCDDCID